MALVPFSTITSASVTLGSNSSFTASFSAPSSSNIGASTSYPYLGSLGWQNSGGSGNGPSFTNGQSGTNFATVYQRWCYIQDLSSLVAGTPPASSPSSIAYIAKISYQSGNKNNNSYLPNLLSSTPQFSLDLLTTLMTPGSTPYNTLAGMAIPDLISLIGSLESG